MPFPPSVFLIGAQKCGTTFLASILDNHKDICVSNPKEPHFFSLKYEKGFDYYRRLFNCNDSKILVDASTTYSFLRPLDRESGPGLPPIVAQRIYNSNNRSKIIYIMRDPVERVCSSFLHMKRRDHRYHVSHNGEISVMDIIRNDPMIEIITRYSNQISIYRDHFDDKSMHFISFNDLKNNTNNVIKEVLNFIGVEPVNQVNLRIGVEKHQRHRMSWLGRHISSLNKHMERRDIRLKQHIPLGVRRLMRGALRRPVADIRFTHIEEAKEYFSDEKRIIKKMTGLDI